MFTGIIESLGQVQKSLPLGDNGRHLVIQGDAQCLAHTKIGDSIAVNGVCLTVVAKDTRPTGTLLSFDASAHTMNATNLCTLNDTSRAHFVNLETALRLGDSLDGHMVYGHVDITCPVISYQQQAESWMLSIACPQDYAHLVCERGSITLNGISLTIAALAHAKGQLQATAAIIPHTHNHTTLRFCQVGEPINVEFDMLARYVAQHMSTQPLCNLS